MGKKALVFLADGFEEVEAVTPIDYLRRSGVEVVIAAIGQSLSVKGSHGIALTADTTIAALNETETLNPADWDCVFVPGGMPGSSNLAACVPVGNFFREMAKAGKTIAAICAAPVVFLAPLGLLEGRKFTCYPGMEQGLTGCTEDRVVIDGNLITSRAAGTAAEFALALIEKLAGGDAAKKLKAATLLPGIDS
ncbi:MAG: DJ-1/PfpI family protein [Spirochaetaceae bacterium]|jgi:4-methyl-5(b-hydroxyethyl)-thiazole monophosphate biosynthesis|nr:DJ-1/PfpI family protein [Spirochaetaceae bacterium]